MKFTNNIEMNDGQITGTREGQAIYNSDFLYSMVTAKEIVNTDAKTTFFDDTSAIGSRTIKANVPKVGTIIRVRSKCLLNSVENPTNIIDIYLNTTNIVTSSKQLGASHTNSIADLEFDLLFTSIGATGTAVLLGKTQISGTSDVSRNLVNDTISIDTTVDNEINVYYTWGTASADNSLKILSTSIQILN